MASRGHPQMQRIMDAIEDRKLRVKNVKTLQSLWAGYGKATEVLAVDQDCARLSLVVKEVVPPDGDGVSHQRKLQSYQVEAAFYRNVAPQLLAAHEPAVAEPLLVQADQRRGSVTLVLADLRDRFPRTIGVLDLEHAKAALTWLAALHAKYWQQDLPTGLWDEGCYWHLATRLDELPSIDQEWADLREAAHEIDGMLKTAQYRTLLHGDAKAANFLFGNEEGGKAVAAAYDFQYTGCGDGMKDVAYLLCSSVRRDVLERCEHELLAHYHSALTSRLGAIPASCYGLEVVQERFELALLDYVRWMAGWGWWGAASWAQRKARLSLATLCSSSTA